MRCFLGLDIDPANKLAIQAWRDKALPGFRAPVPAANFHVTCVFLGQLTPQQLEPLCTQIDQAELSAFKLTFDQLGYWAKPGILWLGCCGEVGPASALAERLSSFARRAHIAIQERAYVPHLTLVRKVQGAPPGALFQDSFSCSFTQLHLFESVSTAEGVHYPIRFSWPLHPEDANKAKSSC